MRWYIGEDITPLQLSSAGGSRASSMRIISSTGSAGQGMVMGEEQENWRSYLILSWQVIGVQLDAAESGRRSLLTGTHNAPYYDTKWKGQDTHKGATSCFTTQPLVSLLSLSSIKKILYNAVILALTVLFWCAAVFLTLTPGLSLWSYRDAGTTQMTRRRRKISTTH